MGLGGPWEPFFGQGPDAWISTTAKSTITVSSCTQSCTASTTTTTSSSSAGDPKKRMAFMFGLFLIFLQCLVQVGNAVLTQFMFQQMEVDSPLLMTYVGISMLMLLLPLEWWNEYRLRRYREKYEIDEAASFDSLAEDIHKISTAQSFESYSCFMDIAKRRAGELVNNHSRQWNHRKHFMAACLLTPAMFLSDWLFNASLR
jgi:hypothetical protein